MPEKLGYDLNHRERGHSPEDIYQMALNKAIKDVKVLGCKKAMNMFSEHTLLEYLLKEGNLSQPAVQLLGDVMSKEGFFYLSLAEAFRAHACLSDRLRYSRIVGGWDLLPRALLSSLSGTVLLNAPVVSISQGRHEVHVHFTTSLQSHSLEVMTADVVLLTASGPALQRISFSPPLTRKRQEALRALHYVAASKVFLSFHRPFWHEEHIMGGHSNTDRPSRLIFYPAPGEGSLLLASYTWSDAAAPFAGLSTEQTLHLVLKDLAALHGPVVYRLWDGRGVVKRWAEDPYSQGGFVVQPPLFGQGTEDYDWSVPYGRIYFAGEHTALPHGWVETAVKSGLRAALRINSNYGYGMVDLETLEHALAEASFAEQYLEGDQPEEQQAQEEVNPDRQDLSQKHLLVETGPDGQQHVFVENIPEPLEHVFMKTNPQEKGHKHQIIYPSEHGHVHGEVIPEGPGHVHRKHGHVGSGTLQHMHGEVDHS
ncbi:L-amino-acid oxidase isoform X3 [Rattus norvegicus]